MVAATALLLGWPGSAPTPGSSAVTPTPPPKPSAGSETSAASLLGWGDPNRQEEFDGPLGAAWKVYDGPGHVDNGRRSPSAITTSEGLLTITGDPHGTTGGMAWDLGQQHGRWEARVRAPASDATYHALLLLWPDAEDWPAGGEVDFMEMLDRNRQTTNVFLHWGEDNQQDKGEVKADATQWHNWAVEWTPKSITTYLDGKQWYKTTDTDMLPPRSMHLAIQLDWFPEKADGPVQESTMQVDWVKQYPL